MCVTRLERIKAINPDFPYSLLRVLIPKGIYRGQMLKMLVRMKIPAKVSRTIPKMPDIT